MINLSPENLKNNTKTVHVNKETTNIFHRNIGPALVNFNLVFELLVLLVATPKIIKGPLFPEL